MGYNGVSFYVHWALLEGKPGEYRADGVFAFEPFFEAAQKAGIYLLAVGSQLSILCYESSDELASWPLYQC